MKKYVLYLTLFLFAIGLFVACTPNSSSTIDPNEGLHSQNKHFSGALPAFLFTETGNAKSLLEKNCTIKYVEAAPKATVEEQIDNILSTWFAGFDIFVPNNSLPIFFDFNDSTPMMGGTMLEIDGRICAYRAHVNQYSNVNALLSDIGEVANVSLGQPEFLALCKENANKYQTRLFFEQDDFNLQIICLKNGENDTDWKNYRVLEFLVSSNKLSYAEIGDNCNINDYKYTPLAYLSGTSSAGKTEFSKYETKSTATMRQYEGTGTTWGCFKIYDITVDGKILFEVEWYQETGFGGIATLDGQRAVFDINDSGNRIRGSFLYSNENVVLEMEESDLPIAPGKYSYEYNSTIYRETTLAGYGELNHDMFFDFLRDTHSNQNFSWEFLGSPGDMFFDLIDLYKVISSNGEVKYYACYSWGYSADRGIYEVNMTEGLLLRWTP